MSLKKQIEAARMPKEVEEKAIQELKRLEVMPEMSAESTVSRNYLDWLIAVPWYKKTRESRDLKRAEEILNTDHYGLEKVKNASSSSRSARPGQEAESHDPDLRRPPGVGKTSLAKSIARRDAPQVRALVTRRRARRGGSPRSPAYVHRAFPGQIIQMMKKAGTMNAVFLLDEVDKMSMDFRGDPSAALLEVLDPEQNYTFRDHYLDVEFDLSHVMFICHGNVLHTVPQALRDRMEVLPARRLHGAEKARSPGASCAESRRGTGLTNRNHLHGRGDQTMISATRARRAFAIWSARSRHLPKGRARCPRRQELGEAFHGRQSDPVLGVPRYG